MGRIKNTVVVVNKVYGPYRGNIKSSIGQKNSRTDYYDEKTGKLLQQRWYGEDGKAVWDRDWDHNDPKNSHAFPHDHPWDMTKTIPRQRPLEYINDDFK